jgi:dipeptidyl aminopeptidase/acylaminoacyl peptidase
MRKLMCVLLAFALTLGMGGALAQKEGAMVASVWFESRGVEVPAYVHMPDVSDGKKVPLVVMAHGHGGSRDENIGFGQIAFELSKADIATIRMDFPGCGDSAEGFQMNTLSNMKQDVLNAIEYAVQNFAIDRDRVGIFGYSMGGRIALELLGERAYDFKAAALLAPAASTPDLKNLFGGEQAWGTMKAEAEANGFVTFTTIYGQQQQLSAQWFADLEAVQDAGLYAKEKYDGPALVIYAEDDEAVSPAVSKAVADALHADVVDATGDGHSYGFYSDKVDVLNTVVGATADFFEGALNAAYTETTGFIDAGDHIIPYTMLVPRGVENAPAVVMCHGYGSNRDEAGGGYALMAPALAKAGIASIRFDVIGCGDSAKDYIDFTLQTAIDDAIRCAGFVAAQPGVDADRIGIMGWSMGGGVALLAAGTDAQFKSVLTWAGAYYDGQINEEQYAVALRDGFYESTFEWRGPLRHSPKMYEVQKQLKVSEIFPGSSAPVCAVNGVLDDVVPPETAEKIVALSKNAESKAVLIEGADHTFNIFTGDMTAFNELMGITRAWFEDTL